MALPVHFYDFWGATLFVLICDSFSLAKTRDKGLCQICSLPVLPKGADNDWDGTIDHIIPVSLDGEHSMANCQLAHRICNSLKNRDGKGYHIDWEEKSRENHYWSIKFARLEKLLGARLRGGKSSRSFAC